MVYAAKTVSELDNVLSAELNKVFDWIKQNKLLLNISKTKSIILGSSHKLSSTPKMSFNLSGEPIEQVDKVKLLGTIIDSRPSWAEHIDTIVKKMGWGISMVRKCLSYVPTHIVDYCAPVWSSASKGQLKKLQTAQNRAARLVLHCPIRTNTISMHRQLLWLTVENRLVFKTTTFFRNTVFCSQPVFLYNQIVVRFILILLGQLMMTR